MWTNIADWMGKIDPTGEIFPSIAFAFVLVAIITAYYASYLLFGWIGWRLGWLKEPPRLEIR